MTIDERLEFLRQSTESLHATCQELHATIAREAEERKERDRQIDERERKGRRAIIAAIATYLQKLDGESNGENNGEA